MKTKWITEAEYKGGYKLYIKFNDGIEGIVDLEGKLDGEVFEPLKKKSNFQKFELNSWTVVWSNGADLAPEYLYNLVLSSKKKAIGTR